MHKPMMTVCHELMQFCPPEGHQKEGEGTHKKEDWRDGWKILNRHNCGPVSKPLVTHIISAQARWLPKVVWLCRLWAAPRSLRRSRAGSHQPVLYLPSKILGQDCVCPKEEHRSCCPITQLYTPWLSLPRECILFSLKFQPEVLSKGSYTEFGGGPGDFQALFELKDIFEK